MSEARYKDGLAAIDGLFLTMANQALSPCSHIKSSPCEVLCPIILYIHCGNARTSLISFSILSTAKCSFQCASRNKRVVHKSATLLPGRNSPQSHLNIQD